ncbi:hypothetical protein OROHE_007245 [Orobanche hederae]
MFLSLSSMLGDVIDSTIWKSLFSVGPLPQNRLEFTMALSDESPGRGVGTGTPGADGIPGGSDR